MSNETYDLSFLKSVKGKVLFGFLVGVAALAASYRISKGAFDEVEKKLFQISTPNEKLNLVNVVFQDILLLNELQSELPGSISSKGSQQEIRDRYLRHSELLRERLDTLSLWFAGNAGQLLRLDSIRYMLDKRGETFDAYLRERRGLETNIHLKKKMNSITELIATSNEAKGDSTVITTEKHTTTTTITKDAQAGAETAGSQEHEDDSKKGFWGKLFKGKKAKDGEQAETGDPVVVRKEEIKVSIDTLKIAKKDTAIQIVGEEVKDMARNQMARANRFLARERQLQLGETLLISKLMEVMREVEGDVLEDMYRDNEQVKDTIGKSIKNIGFILLGVLSLTALLAAWIFADITRSNEYRKKLILAKEEADYHNEAKQRFLANMSHEIRTPLQSIIGFSELARDQASPAHAQLDIIHKSSEHLLHLVNEILDYSRIISDSFEFADDSFDIGQVLDEVVDTLRPQAVAKGLKLTLKNDFAKITCVSGDAFRLRQILHNLIGNAIKFTRTGSVTVTAGCVLKNRKEEIRISVRDTGIGMRPEQVRRIFNQFEQAHTGITPEYGGSGLGLSIVRELVEGQGGRVEVESKAGEFSLFTVYLPFRKGEPVEKDNMAVRGPLSGFEFAGKVWVIDDDKFILQWLKAVLEKMEVPVSAFHSPIEADQASWEPGVTLVFIDMRMPGLSGPDLCRRLKKKAGNAVRFVACTAMALPGERTRILEMGFDEVLMKPFKKEDILRVLRKWGQPANTHHNRTGPEGANLQSSRESASKEPGMLNISNLVSMTMGDEQLLKESLSQFVEDTFSDLAQVEDCLENEGSREQLRELFHRLAGRTGQVGAAELGSKMRQIELALAGDAPLSRPEIKSAVTSAHRLIEEIQEKYMVS